MRAATVVDSSPGRVDAGQENQAGDERHAPSVLSPPGFAVAFRPEPPAALADLHLLEVIEKITKDGFGRSVWFTPVPDLRVVQYRQAVIAELFNPHFRQVADGLVDDVLTARRAISAADRSHYALPADLARVEAIGRFTSSIFETVRKLSETPPTSAGLRTLAQYLAELSARPGFRQLASTAAGLLDELHGLEFEIGIQGPTVWVGPKTDRAPWVDVVRDTFRRFHSGASGEWAAALQRPQRYLNHVEAQVIELIARQFPDTFARIREFAAANTQFLPARLERLAAELRFYLEYLKTMDDLERAGVSFGLPKLRTGSGAPVRLRGLVDVALAMGATSEEAPLVPNDLEIASDERFVFVTGPNQGGKTTLARAIGQAAYLASLGLPVPARSASLPLLHPVLSHFPRPDDVANQRGGLADEIARLHTMVEAAGENALLILNELFSATSAEDALQLSALVLEQFKGQGCRVVWVTFLEDLVESVEGAVSLVGQVDPAEPTRPTFRFRAQPPAGKSHATALAARHGLSVADLAERLP